MADVNNRLAPHARRPFALLMALAMLVIFISSTVALWVATTLASLLG